MQEVLRRIPELELACGVGQGPYHHLDVFEHTLEVARRVEEELAESRLGAILPGERLEGLRLAALLHDVAKPLTCGELGGRVVFVAHDSLGASMVRRVCRRLGLPAESTDAAATITALHLKIGFMQNERTDYPPERIVRVVGPFGEELAVLSLADRLAAQGPRLEERHLERHERLCREFLVLYRERGPHPMPDYDALARCLPEAVTAADVGYAAGVLRAMMSRGMGEEAGLRYLSRVLSGMEGPSC